jgi:hypothetical protein
MNKRLFQAEEANEVKVIGACSCCGLMKIIMLSEGEVSAIYALPPNDARNIARAILALADIKPNGYCDLSEVETVGAA